MFSLKIKEFFGSEWWREMLKAKHEEYFGYNKMFM